MSRNFFHFARIAIPPCLLLFALAGCAARGGFYHRVQKGETLYRISRAYDVSMENVARANNMRHMGELREGQYLKIPDDAGTTTPDPEKLKPPSRKSAPHAPPSPDVRRAPGEGKQARQAVRQRRSVEAPRRLQASNLRGRFQWPVQPTRLQQVSRPFGSFGHQRHTGIDIALLAGTSVLSAAAGTVVYAGDGVQGFGKTVIVRHAEEIFTVYSHLGRISVKDGQSLRRGEVIGAAGKLQEKHFGQQYSLLHFEIRERTVPVNPELLLP